MAFIYANRTIALWSDLVLQTKAVDVTEGRRDRISEILDSYQTFTKTTLNIQFES
jgi:hypothetical protein